MLDLAKEIKALVGKYVDTTGDQDLSNYWLRASGGGDQAIAVSTSCGARFVLAASSPAGLGEQRGLDSLRCYQQGNRGYIEPAILTGALAAEMVDRGIAGNRLEQCRREFCFR
ncbi:hypothetical protein PF001_g22072 [Phytophthora fragariae]|uniref:Uncharacterized protein n=2 Tax=Phytophthora fragariae TaxID=53985 RepID=A0A6A4C9X6_9STRA|nr:hypothetical protein PF001_g22072 [Phytophthora fragariae]